MEFSTILLVVNLCSTLFMVGLIWMVQIVHYPLFAAVGSAEFVNYQQRHQVLITLVVGPAMLIEAASAILLLSFRPPAVNLWMVVAGIGLVFVIWLSTAAIQVPCHGKLAAGFDARTHQTLVRSNWIRTISWTARGWLSAWMLIAVLTQS